MKLLQKGQAEVLLKRKYDLSEIIIGSGWAGEGYDLDLFAVLLGERGQVLDDIPLAVPLRGRRYTYPSSGHSNQNGSVVYGGDSKGGSGGDDETLKVRLDRMASAVKRVLFVLVLYMGREEGQRLSGVRNAYIRAVDKRNTEMLRYKLAGAAGAPGKYSILFGELVKVQGNWAFEAVGEYYAFDSQIEFVKQLRDKPLIRANPTLAAPAQRAAPPAPRRGPAPPQRKPARSTAQQDAAAAFDAAFRANQQAARQAPQPAKPAKPAKRVKETCGFCGGAGCNFCGGTGKL